VSPELPQPQPPINGKRALYHLAWPGIFLLGLIMVASVGLVGVAFMVAPNAVGELGQALTEINALSRVTAMIIIVPGVLILALLDKVEGAAAVALLAAIAGYVLAGNSGK
jgi:ABC-type Mn2+/Zn2+ transport system permease subunit